MLNNHAQVISRLEVQMSQLVSSLSERQLVSSLTERPKGALPSQPLVNSKNSCQAYKVQDSQINQYNVVHTLR